jgi:hypothetical protein
MQPYRLFFRCRGGTIIGREDLIDAEDDCSALAIGTQLFDACSDLAALALVGCGATSRRRDPGRHYCFGSDEPDMAVI